MIQRNRDFSNLQGKQKFVGEIRSKNAVIDWGEGTSFHEVRESDIVGDPGEVRGAGGENFSSPICFFRFDFPSPTLTAPGL